MADASHATLVAPSAPLYDGAELAAAGFLARYGGLTRSNYTGHLRLWFQWCADHGVPVLEAKRAHIELFARHLEEERGLKRSTVAGRLSTVVGFYRFAWLDGVIEHSPAAHVRRPKVEYASSTDYLTRTELADVISAAEARPMDLALVCLLGLNGLRVSEATGIDIEHLGFDHGYHVVQITRKGGAAATVPLSPRTSWAVQAIVAGRSTGPLLLTRTGSRMNRKAASRVVKRLARQVGIKKRIHPHSFRHSFVTLSLDAGVPQRDVQAAAGHKSSHMTAYYDRNRESVHRHATHALSAFVAGAG